MKTLSELKQFCEKNNVRYELSPKYSNSEYLAYNKETDKWEWEKVIIGYQFGMNNIAGRKGKSEWQWTWFDTFKTEIDDNTNFYFSHRYSQVNGCTYKGIDESIAADNTIERRMK